jgi:diacylglycerol kinase (ATP)
LTQTKRRKGLSGFKYAQDGVLHCFRTQLHMRFHFYILVGVLLSGLLLDLAARDMLVLVFAITLVIVTEMINTAVEAIVNMVTEQYSQGAKLAKDVAAGAVLIAAMNAIIAGTIIFFGQARLDLIQKGFQKEVTPDVAQVIVIGIVVLALIVIISKLLSRTGSPWHGGIISGHSAIGFLLAMVVFFTSHNPVATFLSILLAVLVAQSRVEAGVHSVQEVILGAVLAILLTSLVYWIMPKARNFVGRRRAAHSQVLYLSNRRLTANMPLTGAFCVSDSACICSYTV